MFHLSQKILSKAAKNQTLEKSKLDFNSIAAKLQQTDDLSDKVWERLGKIREMESALQSEQSTTPLFSK